MQLRHPSKGIHAPQALPIHLLCVPLLQAAYDHAGLQRNLESNYRSRPAILKAAEAVLGDAVSFAKRLLPVKQDDAVPVQYWVTGARYLTISLYNRHANAKVVMSFIRRGAADAAGEGRRGAGAVILGDGCAFLLIVIWHYAMWQKPASL